MKVETEIPDETELTVSGQQLIAKGPKGEVSRIFPTGKISVSVEGKTVAIENKIGTQFARTIASTFRAHIKNMLAGVKEPFVYKLKVTSVHFPMKVEQAGTNLKITNFLGSKKPIDVKMPSGLEVNVNGSDITLTSPDIEIAGMAATRLEQATRLSNKDRRIFQDGIFIVEKAGKPVK